MCGVREYASGEKVCWGWLSEGQKVVERVIVQVKTWRVVHSRFRCLLRVYGRMFSSGAGVGVFAAGRPFMYNHFI